MREGGYSRRESSPSLPLTSSITWPVDDLRASQVFSPTWRTRSSPSRAARRPFFAFRFSLVVFVGLGLPTLASFFDGVFRAERFLGARLALRRFAPAVRFVDFLVEAIYSSMSGKLELQPVPS